MLMLVLYFVAFLPLALLALGLMVVGLDEAGLWLPWDVLFWGCGGCGKRGLRLRRENAARARRNDLRALARQLYGLAIQPALPSGVTVSWLEGSWRRPSPPARIEDMLDQLRREWEGELEVDDQGALLYTFPRLHREWQEVARARERVDAREHRIGPIDGSSDH